MKKKGWESENEKKVNICWLHHGPQGRSHRLWCRGHRVVQSGAAYLRLTVMAGLKWTSHIWEREKKSKHPCGLWPFRKCFSVIINRDVSAQPIGFRDAIRIQMKRTPVLSLILVYPFYLGTHSSLITMGQGSGGTKPCRWYSCKWEKKSKSVWLQRAQNGRM